MDRIYGYKAQNNFPIEINGDTLFNIFQGMVWFQKLKLVRNKCIGNEALE